MGWKFYTFADGDDSFVCVDSCCVRWLPHRTRYGPARQNLRTRQRLAGRAADKCAPDLIALAGDIADEESNLQDLSRLLPRLAAIAPCYYVTGNHEWRMENRKQWFELLSACGVTRLENSFVMLSREGGSVVLAGVDDPNGPADQKTPGQLLQEIHEAAPQAYTIVLCHRERSAGALRAPGRRSGFERACARRRGPAALPWRGLRHAL